MTRLTRVCYCWMGADVSNHFITFNPGEMGRRVVESVVRQHAEEAAFQWVRRSSAVRSPKYSLKDIAALDNRVEAHVDGLRLAGEQAWVVCEEALANDPGEMFAATAFAFRAAPDKLASRLETLLARLESAPELQRGFLGGLGFSSWPSISTYARSWLASDAPLLKALGLAAFRIHQRAPPDASLQQALAMVEPEVLQEALSLVGELAVERSAPTIPAEPKGPARLRLLWALSSLHLQRTAPAMPVLHSLADEDSREAQPAAELLVRRLDEQSALKWIRQGMGRPDRRRRAVLAVGAAGYPKLVDDLVSLMEDEAIARAAGFAFTMLTGADLEFLDLDGEPPIPSDEEVDSAIADPDAELPWPHVARIRDWWAQNKKDYLAGRRYLMGLPVERASLQRVLVSGKQPHRRAAALEQVLLDAKTPLYPTSKPGWAQARDLLGWP